MEKTIDVKILKDIVTKHAMFDNILSMGENMLVRRNIYDTIDKYAIDNHVNFEFIDMKTVYESDYYHDYDGKLYKNKKPPFVCALMENLAKHTGFPLATYYIEALTKNILEEANAKGKSVFDPNKSVEVSFTVYSGELIVTDHMTLPSIFSQMLVKMYNKSKLSLNTIEGQVEFTQYASSQYDVVHFSKAQQELLMFKDSGSIMFGQVNEKAGDYDQIRAKYSEVTCVSDESTLILMDRYSMEELLSKVLGKTEAKYEMEKFIKECPWVLHHVPSDTYTFKFMPNQENFKVLEENKAIAKEYSNEINPICILKQKSLEHTLDEKTKLKM